MSFNNLKTSIKLSFNNKKNHLINFLIFKKSSIILISPILSDKILLKMSNKSNNKKNNSISKKLDKKSSPSLIKLSKLLSYKIKIIKNH